MKGNGNNEVRLESDINRLRRLPHEARDLAVFIMEKLVQAKAASGSTEVVLRTDKPGSPTRIRTPSAEGRLTATC